MGKGRGGMWSIGNGGPATLLGSAVGWQPPLLHKRLVVAASGIVARCEDDPLRRSPGRTGTSAAVGLACGRLSGCCRLGLACHHLVTSS